MLALNIRFRIIEGVNRLDEFISKSKRNRNNMEVSIAPLRSLDDFLLGQSRFQIPDLKNPEKWANRIVNNLLYYQTNYMLSGFIIFTLISFLNPHHMFYGILTMSIVFGLLYYAAHAKDDVGKFKKNHPLLVMLSVFCLGYFIIYKLGCILVFLFGVMVPFLFAIIHSTLRLRNLKNKVANVADVLGFSKNTPMSIFLNEWGIEPDLKYIS